MSCLTLFSSLFLFFFFLMLRRPPRSTLFPTRRSSDLSAAGDHIGRRRAQDDRLVGLHALEKPALEVAVALDRSEEHTSELQSHSDLVCRLLLEKKNNQQHSGVDRSLLSG